jgi:hypothetical protein
MNAQQLHDYIIKPTLEYMEGNYNTPEARLLLLATAAIESDCGYYIKQVNGPALGIWQMESDTHEDIWLNCDSLRDSNFAISIGKLEVENSINISELISSPQYACAMARLKYSMDSVPLPKVTSDRKLDEVEFYRYYKRVYNTNLGASTFGKWQVKCEKHNIFEVKL